MKSLVREIVERVTVAADRIEIRLSRANVLENSINKINSLWPVQDLTNIDCARKTPAASRRGWN
jgi:hypothetical protein